MAADLRQSFDADVQIVPGARGAFEVHVDGRLVFSKLALGRFPEPDEIFAHLKARS